MLLQAASPLALPVIVLDPDTVAPAKQVSQPALIPLVSQSLTGAEAPLRHVDGAFTSASKIRELAQLVDVLTIEIEHVDVTALEEVANEFKMSGGRSGKGIKVFPSPAVIRIIQDKYAQKVHLSARGVEAAPFCAIEDCSSSTAPANVYAALAPAILSAGDLYGYPLMLKSRHLAYDGKGNHVLRSASTEHVQAALDSLIPSASITSTSKPLGERLYAEKFAPFVMEVAVMVVRGASGESRTYPAVETIHRESVCHIVYAPLRPAQGAAAGVGREQRGRATTAGQSVGERARDLAQRAVDALGAGAIGVFGVEMFLMEDGRSCCPACCV